MALEGKWLPSGCLVLAVGIFTFPGWKSSSREPLVRPDREQQEACHTWGLAQVPKHVNLL